MKNPSDPPKQHRHDEIITRLDRIIALLSEQTKDSSVEEAVVAAAKEYYTNADLLTILRVTKRTLARYRQMNLIP
jgi:predicted Zn-ribbon and HTH transcriptional regulator